MVGQKRFKKRMGVVRSNGHYRKKAKHYVPGIGGVVGRLAKAGQGYVSKGGIAYKALALARKVANAVNTEYKYFDVSATASTADYNGTVTILNNPAQGSTDATRIGDSIKVQNDMLRFMCYRNGADAVMRVIVYWDDQNQITSGATMLESVGSVYATLSPKLYDSRFRSKILFDKTYVIDQINQSTYDESIQLKVDQHTQFSAGSTTITTGALKILFISNVTANPPAYNLYSRMTFTDN